MRIGRLAAHTQSHKAISKAMSATMKACRGEI